LHIKLCSNKKATTKLMVVIS